MTDFDVPVDLKAQHQKLQREEEEEEYPAADADHLVLNHLRHEVSDDAA